MDSKKAVEREKSFWKVKSRLANLGSTYVSLLLFDEVNNLVYSKSSNPDWADEFTSTGLYKKCHLLNEANQLMNLQHKSFTLSWDLHPPNTEDAMFLDDIRKLKDITHGVGFCIKNGNSSTAMLNIAGKYSDINFGLNVLRNRMEVYKDLYELIRSSKICE